MFKKKIWKVWLVIQRTTIAFMLVQRKWRTLQLVRKRRRLKIV